MEKKQCSKCGKKGLGLIINGVGKKVLTEFNIFGETAHSLTCGGNKNVGL